MKLRPRLTAFLTVFVVATSACNGDSPINNVGTPGIKLLFGAGVSDTVDAVQQQALVVEVRSANGEPARGTQVRFEARASADPSRSLEPTLFVCSVSALVCGPSTGSTSTVETADDNGVARALVRLGHVAGSTVVRISSTTLPYKDSVTYTVLAGTAVAVRAPVADTLLQIGTVTSLPGKLFDRYNNLRADAAVVSAGFGSSIALAAATSSVTANVLGVQRLYYKVGALMDSTKVTVLPSARLLAYTSAGGAVQLFNIDGSAVRTLSTNNASNIGVFPRFDPSRQRVSLYNQSGNAQVVIDTLGVTLRNIPRATAFNWVITQRQMADGTILVVGQRAGTLVNALYRLAADNSITFVANLPGADSVYNSGDILNTNTMLYPYGTYGAADISPDGTRVAYVAGPPRSAQLSLRVLNVATGGVAILDQNARSPRWSPLGDQIAYLVGRQSEGSPIVGFPNVIKADGTERKEVGSFDLHVGLAWSPDGVHLVGRDPNSGRLRVLNVNTGANVVLSWLKSDYVQPDWR